MAVFEASVRDVGASGKTVAITIPRHYTVFPIDRLDIVKTAGSATAVDWELNEADPAEEIKQIAEDDGATLPVHVQATEGGWSWDPTGTVGDTDVHLTIEPDDAATLNDFDVRIHIDKHE